MILETADEYKQQAETTNKAVKTVVLRCIDILFMKRLNCVNKFEYFNQRS